MSNKHYVNKKACLEGQAGFAPIIVTLILLVSLFSGVFLVEKQTNILSKTFKGSTLVKESSPLPTPFVNSPSPSVTSSPSAKNSNKNQIKKSPTPKPNATLNPVTKVNPTIKPTLKPSATCQINALVDTDNSLAVKLTYGAFMNSNVYTTAYQWDFDGNGSWDTDFSFNNSEKTYIYPSIGNYNPKLQVKLSDGSITDVCTKTISVPVGITISYSGTVFKDENCNDYRDSNEQPISGQSIRFFKQDYNIYKTISSESNGNFNLTVNIPSDDSLTLQTSPDLNNGGDPSIVSYSPYKIHYNPPFITLNNNQRSIKKDIPLVPSGNIGSCTN